MSATVLGPVSKPPPRLMHWSKISTVHTSIRCSHQQARLRRTRQKGATWLQAQTDPGKEAEKLKSRASDQANEAMDDFEDSLDSKPASEVLDNLIGVHKYARALLAPSCTDFSCILVAFGCLVMQQLPTLAIGVQETSAAGSLRGI